VIIYQGGKDPTVPQAATDLLKTSAEAKGTKIQYITNADWDHGTVYTSNFDSFVANVKTLFAQ
jgi:hypothetical protein